MSNTGDRFAAGYKHVALQLIGRPACSLQPAVLQWPLVSAIIVVTGSANIAHPPYLHNLTIYLSIYHCWLNSREKLDRLRIQYNFILLLNSVLPKKSSAHWFQFVVTLGDATIL